jgi:hypothetical protein
MSGEHDPAIIDGIERLLNILVRNGHDNIHLVVTKWDLLTGPGGLYYTISEVREALSRTSPLFADFQLHPTRVGSTRLIPVSALGLKGFAVYDEAVDGHMAKTGEPWEPWNVEIPFFCALPDILQVDVARLAERHDWNPARITSAIINTLEVVVQGAGVAVQSTLLGGLFTINAPIHDFVHRIFQRVREWTKEGQAAATLSPDTALSYLLSESDAATRTFEWRAPDSRLRQPGTDD